MISQMTQQELEAHISKINKQIFQLEIKAKRLREQSSINSPFSFLLKRPPLAEPSILKKANRNLIKITISNNSGNKEMKIPDFSDSSDYGYSSAEGQNDLVTESEIMRDIPKNFHSMINDHNEEVKNLNFDKVEMVEDLNSFFANVM